LDLSPFDDVKVLNISDGGCSYQLKLG